MITIANQRITLMERVRMKEILGNNENKVSYDGGESCPVIFASPDELYDTLIKRIRRYHPSTDISMVEKAYKIATDAHGLMK